MVTLAAVGCLAGTAVQAASSPYPSRYSEYYEITAHNGMLIGGEGRTGDSMRYRGRRIWSGPGTATVLVRERSNTGMVMGSIRAKGRTYTVLMNEFNGDRPFQSGGIARNVMLHGLTAQGGPFLPQTFAYLAGWGSPCTVWKDAEVLYDGYRCHFMLTEKVRDPETGEIRDFPGKEKVRQLIRGERWQGDYEGNEDIRQQIRESGDAGLKGLQLHLFAHSPERDTANLPPYETTMHFVWNDVQWWGGPEPAGGRWSDKEINRMVERELRANTLVEAEDIDVRVKNGRVTLTGTAQTPTEKNHAYFSAWVPGVTSVRNDIQVRRQEPLSDKELQRAITYAYGLDPRIVHSRPKVKVRDGVVTLSGTVADDDAKNAAEEIAMQFEGVSDVKNRLKTDESLPKGERQDIDAIVFYDIEPMEPGISRADRELQQDIESQLTWSPYVDADRVEVSVLDGVAYLFGTVEDQDARQAAIDNAFDAGAERVVSYLETEEA
ncbi:BON domain-containing protein [Nitrospira moscoviensis]|nr:BON domain-containing protein [Nitrospira moscoviensis]